MSVSTHRWRPDLKSKSGYYNIKRFRKVQHSKVHEKCSIVIKFEKSSYFRDARLPIPKLLNGQNHEDLKEEEYRPINKESHYDAIGSVKQSGNFHPPKHLDSTLSVESSIEVKLRKLTAIEYSLSNKMSTLWKLRVPKVRVYIVLDKEFIKDDALELADRFKAQLRNSEWASIRLLMTGKKFNIKEDVLRKTPGVPPPKKYSIDLTMSMDSVIEPIEDIMAKEDDYTQSDEDTKKILSEDDLDTKSNVTIDEEQEEKILSKMNMRYRDSRIITTNRKKVPDQTIDPVEKCFLALTKMLEDQIFSAGKGLNEITQEIDEMMNQVMLNDQN